MAISNNLGHMTEFSRKHPRSFFISTFITSPLNQVKEVTMSLASVNLRVKDLGDLILGFAIHFYWWWQKLGSFWYSIRGCRF